METVKLSSKGQIVIPKNIRDDLHLPPGTEFVISKTATGLTLTATTIFPASTVREVRGFLAKRGRHLTDENNIRSNIKAHLKARDEADLSH